MKKLFENVYRMSEGTSNFGTPEGPFALTVFYSERWCCKCPECESFVSEGEETKDGGYRCPDCGHVIDKDTFDDIKERDYDDEQFDYEYANDEFESKKQDLPSLRYYEVFLDSGYYEGTWVNIKETGSSVEEDYAGYQYSEDVYNLMQDCDAFTDEEANKVAEIYEGTSNDDFEDDEVMEKIEKALGMSRNKIWEKADEYLKDKEEHVIDAFLDDLCDNCGFEQYTVAYRFSNGETGYNKIDRSKGLTVKQVVQHEINS